jgi:hypothetical protein
MAAKDRFHAVVRIALEKEQWQITDDPLRLEVGGTKFEIDLARISHKRKKSLMKSHRKWNLFDT